MTGIESAIQLNPQRPGTKILLISGLATGLLVLNGGWQFLPKPFVSDMLRDRIRDFLSEQPPIQRALAGRTSVKVLDGFDESNCESPFHGAANRRRDSCSSARVRSAKKTQKQLQGDVPQAASARLSALKKLVPDRADRCSGRS
jgi:hypothetical protein